jgi:multiple sugar transport system permease protein
MYEAVGGAGNVAAFQTTLQGGDLDPFLLGKIVMKIDGFWQLGGILAPYGRDLNYGVAPPPMPARELAKGRKPVTWMGGWCLSIPSTSRNKEAAWELIRFLSSKKAIQIAAESQRLTTESQGRTFIPGQVANREISQWLFERYVYSNPLIDSKLASACRVFTSMVEDARYRPVSPVGQLLWNEHATATDNAIFKKLTPQQALDRATLNVQRQLDKVLAPPKGRQVHWPLFFAAYALILIAAAAVAYQWDTNGRFRGALARVGLRSAGKGALLEGLQSSYFRSQWKGGVLCALPWILGFIVFTGGPLLFSIVMSFCEYDIFNPPRLIGTDNYRWMLNGDPLFWKSMGNTLYMVIGIPLGMSLSLGIALLLNLKVRGIAVWRTFFYLPSIVPAVASSILWIWIFNPSAGLLNGALASFGIQGPNWLQDENTSKLSLILMGLWGAGGGMIIWLAGLKGISASYYEAATLDGAGAWQKFRHVTLPLLSPYIFFNLIMGLIGTFQIFSQAFIMTAGGPVNSTLFYAYHLFNNAFRYLHMGYACAMGWVLFVIVFVLTILQMKLSKRWVHYEGD